MVVSGMLIANNSFKFRYKKPCYKKVSFNFKLRPRTEEYGCFITDKIATKTRGTSTFSRQFLSSQLATTRTKRLD